MLLVGDAIQARSNNEQCKNTKCFLQICSKAFEEHKINLQNEFYVVSSSQRVLTPCLQYTSHTQKIAVKV